MDLTKNIGAINSKTKKTLYIILSFVIPFIVIVLALIALHIDPFGDHSLAISDGKGYVYGLPDFVRLIKGQEDWMYSLHSLGGNRWSSLAWGGIAPASILAVFSTPETIPAWMAWISTVNLSLCGLTMYILLSYVRGHKLSNLIFSTSYAMIGFNVVNCFQMLFFIGPQLLPIVVLGLIKLMKGKSPLTYIISLGACIFLNFYFGFQICVASLVFFLGYLHVHKDELAGKKKRLFGTWFVSSIIAGLLAAPMWLPALKAFSGGGRLDQTGIAEFTFKENMPFIQIFSKLFSGANSTDEMVNGLPNIFCGILVVALVVLFFMNKKISIRKKRAAGIVIGFYLLTFYITAFTLAMHGGTHTNWFPYRYSYIFSFILIFLASDEYDNLDDVTLKETKKVGIGLLIAAVLIFSTSYGFVSGGAVVLDFALLFLMWLGFRIYKIKPEKAPARVISLFLIILVCGNLYANYILSISKVKEWELDNEIYQTNIMKYSPLIDGIRAADTELYRLEKDNSDTQTLGADPGFYNYYGVSGSGPAIRAFINRESCKIGINWWNMRHWYSEGIPAATDALFGLKYVISNRDLSEEKGYESKIGVEDEVLYQNHNALKISVLSNSQVGNLELGDNLFENLNNIWKSMTGEKEDIFTEQQNVLFTLKNDTANQSITSMEIQESIANAEDGKESEYVGNSIIEYTFVAERTGPIYVFDTSIPGSVDGLMTPAIRYVGYYHKGDTVVNHFTVNSGLGTGDIMRGYCANQVFAYADADVLAGYANQLNERDISINMEKESHLHGTFIAQKGQKILFTLPWDEGWSCYIDGQKVPIGKTWKLFMSVEVPEGEHTWEMRFFPAWMNYGLILCAVAFAGLIILMIVWNKNKKKEAVAASGVTMIVDNSEGESEIETETVIDTENKEDAEDADNLEKTKSASDEQKEESL